MTPVQRFARVLRAPDVARLLGAAVLARMPIGRLLNVTEMAEIAFQLCRPAFGAIVGQTIVADGGSSLT